MLKLEGKGAAYIRVSDDSQDPERQRKSIEAFCSRYDLHILASNWFVDVGWSRDRTDRPGFTELLRAIELGQIQWVVVDQPDRFGTATVLEYASYLHQLSISNCLLVSVEGEILGGEEFHQVLQALITGERSIGELKQKSWRTLSSQTNLAGKGLSQGGLPPFGLDKACVDPITGEEKWRVVVESRNRRLKVYPDGRESERFDGKDNSPPKSGNEVFRLVPSRDEVKLDAIRAVFRMYATESISMGKLARFLNDSGYRSSSGAKFTQAQIKKLLENPVYIGRPAYNKTSNAKYHESDGQTVKKVSSRDKKQRAHSKDEWIQPVIEIFEPVVDRNTWDAVQKKLEKPRETRTAVRNPNLIFSGLLYCADCGARMVAHRQQNRDGSRTQTYFCGSYKKAKGDGSESPCKRNTVQVDAIMPSVDKYLDELNEDLLLLEEAQNSEDNALVERARARFASDIKDMMEAKTRICFLLSYANQHLGIRPNLRIPRIAFNNSKVESIEEINTKLNQLEEIMASVDKADEWSLEHRAAFTKTLSVIDDAFTQIFPQVREKLEVEREKLRRELRTLSQGMMQLPGTAKHARRMAEEDMLTLERKLDAVEEALKDQSGKLRKAKAFVKESRKNIDQARTVFQVQLDEATNRRMAEALRKVILRIDLRSEPTGKRSPSTRLREITITPVTGEPRKFSVSPESAVVTTGRRSCDSRVVPSSRVGSRRRVRRVGPTLRFSMRRDEAPPIAQGRRDRR